MEMIGVLFGPIYTNSTPRGMIPSFAPNVLWSPILSIPAVSARKMRSAFLLSFIMLLPAFLRRPATRGSGLAADEGGQANDEQMGGGNPRLFAGSLEIGQHVVAERQTE